MDHETNAGRVAELREALLAGYDEVRDNSDYNFRGWVSDVTRDPGHAFYTEAVEFVQLTDEDKP